METRTNKKAGATPNAMFGIKKLESGSPGRSEGDSSSSSSHSSSSSSHERTSTSSSDEVPTYSSNDMEHPITPTDKGALDDAKKNSGSYSESDDSLSHIMCEGWNADKASTENAGDADSPKQMKTKGTNRVIVQADTDDVICHEGSIPGTEGNPRKQKSVSKLDGNEQVPEDDANSDDITYSISQGKEVTAVKKKAVPANYTTYKRPEDFNKIQAELKESSASDSWGVGASSSSSSLYSSSVISDYSLESSYKEEKDDFAENKKFVEKRKTSLDKAGTKPKGNERQQKNQKQRDVVMAKQGSKAKDTPVITKPSASNARKEKVKKTKKSSRNFPPGSGGNKQPDSSSMEQHRKDLIDNKFKTKTLEIDDPIFQFRIATEPLEDYMSALEGIIAQQFEVIDQMRELTKKTIDMTSKMFITLRAKLGTRIYTSDHPIMSQMREVRDMASNVLNKTIIPKRPVIVTPATRVRGDGGGRSREQSQETSVHSNMKSPVIKQGGVAHSIKRSLSNINMRERELKENESHLRQKRQQAAARIKDYRQQSEENRRSSSVESNYRVSGYIERTNSTQNRVYVRNNYTKPMTDNPNYLTMTSAFSSKMPSEESMRNRNARINARQQKKTMDQQAAQRRRSLFKGELEQKFEKIQNGQQPNVMPNSNEVYRRLYPIPKKETPVESQPVKKQKVVKQSTPQKMERKKSQPKIEEPVIEKFVPDSTDITTQISTPTEPTAHSQAQSTIPSVPSTVEQNNKPIEEKKESSASPPSLSIASTDPEESTSESSSSSSDSTSDTSDSSSSSSDTSDD